MRGLFAALLGLTLGLRVFASAGLMPTVEQGQLTIIACPDAGDDAPLAIGGHHHHQHGKPVHVHPLCPYAAASWLSFVSSEVPALPAALIIIIASLAIAVLSAAARAPTHLRPFVRGPPLPA